MKAFYIFALLCVLIFSPPARAGTYTDELTKCLVSVTTGSDKVVLVKWFFSATALNKEVAPYVNMPPAARSAIDNDVAQLYMRLLTESCRSQTRDAFKNEGQVAIAAAFQVLGQVASQVLYEDPVVVEGMTGMIKLMDEQKLKAVFDGK